MQHARAMIQLRSAERVSFRGHLEESAARAQLRAYAGRCAPGQKTALWRRGPCRVSKKTPQVILSNESSCADHVIRAVLFVSRTGGNEERVRRLLQHAVAELHGP